MQDLGETGTHDPTAGVPRNDRKRSLQDAFGFTSTGASSSSPLNSSLAYDSTDHYKPPKKIQCLSEDVEPSTTAATIPLSATTRTTATTAVPSAIFSHRSTTAIEGTAGIKTYPDAGQLPESDDLKPPKLVRHHHENNGDNYSHKYKYNYNSNFNNDTDNDIDINTTTSENNQRKTNESKIVEQEKACNKRKPETITFEKECKVVAKEHNVTSNEDRTSALYGDIINLAVGVVSVIIYGAEFFRLAKDDPIRDRAIDVVITMHVPLFISALAFHTKDLWLSRLGTVVLAITLGQMDMADWPHPGVSKIKTIVQSQMFMSVLSNISLSSVEKMLRLAFLFGVGSFFSIKHPHSDFRQDFLPAMCGTVLLIIFILWVCNTGVSRKISTVHASRFVLASLFIYHTATDMASTMSSSRALVYTVDTMSSYLKAVFLASLGVVATGAFQQEIQHREKEIKCQNKKLRMVGMALQASETAIAVTEQNGRIVWINAAFERMCKKPQELLIHKSLKDAVHEIDPTRKENRFALFNSLEDSTNVTEEEIQIGDSMFRLEATPFLENNDDEGGETDSEDGSGSGLHNDRFLMVFKDITSYRARELAEKEAQDKAMMAKAMGDAMVTLTHELRTPLQGIMGVTSLLLQQAGDMKNDMLDSLKLIMASSGLLLNLINNLLDIKKINAKMMEEFPLTSIVASDPIKDAVGFCQPLASIFDVKIDMDLKSAPKAIVTSNALRLQQILINLISNAIKFTKTGSEIRVRIRKSTLGETETMAAAALACSQSPNALRGKEQEDNRGNDGNVGSDAKSPPFDSSTPVLVISVSDCGPGIAPNHATRLFQRYAQLDTKPRNLLGNKGSQTSGTGLGLNLCNLFVERMNGRIWATNNGRNCDGATFSFYLPLVAIDQHQNYAAVAGLLSATARNPPRSISASEKRDNGAVSLLQMRVLLVDDTLINRKVFHRMLKEIGVTNSVTVESGEKALEELSSNAYDLVITDLQMPGMSGTDLSRAINNRSISPPVVVALTANNGIDVVENCAASGMADVLYKPMTLSELRCYFETTVPKLQPGVWYDNRLVAQ